MSEEPTAALDSAPSELPVSSAECGFPDPGTLPAWNVGQLPDPPKFGVLRALRMIGPGVILVGAAIGSGEWLLGPALTAKYAGTMLWIATVSVILQFCLNQEVSRYTLATGEPIFTAYMRCWPSSKWYSAWYLGLGATGLWPGLATNAATAMAAGLLSVQHNAHVIPTEADAFLVTSCAYAIFAVCVLLVLFGGKVYNMLQVTITFMVVWILGYLIFVDVGMTSWRSWDLVIRGFLNFGYLPAGEKLDWTLIAGFAAFAGAGGLGNAAISNYVRDKGWGMGSLVGAIPSAVGGKQIQLSHLGMVFPVTPENVRKFREWWKFILFDQGVIWGGGCLLGIALPAILAIEFIDPDLNLGQWQAAAFQAEGIAKRYGSVFWYLTLLCGFWVLFSSQLVVVDMVGRGWSDMIWTGSQPGREERGLGTLWMGLAATVGLVLLTGLAPAVFAGPAYAVFSAVALAALGLCLVGRWRWSTLALAVLIASAGLVSCYVVATVVSISRSQLLLAAVFLYGVPAAIWSVRNIASRIQAEQVETRVLTPLVIFYLVSVLGCVAMSALKVGQSVGPDGEISLLVGWNTTVKVFVFGTAWLVGSAFVLARNMQPHNVYKIYYLAVGMYVTWCCIAMQIVAPLTMILIMSNIAGFLLAISALHTLYVNRRFLPHELRPRWWKQLALLACAGWYFFMSFMALDARLTAQIGFSPLEWLKSWSA